MTKRAPVTDHALLRWLDRVYGLDLDSIRDQIATPAIRSAILAGAAAITIDGFTYVLQDRQVVTVHRAKHEPLGHRKYREIEDDDDDEA